MTPSETAMRNETTYSTPSDHELLITRTFDAPRALVWAAFTDPKHVPNWQTGPGGFTMPVCEIDLRPGGTWHYTWRNAKGREFSATGTYREVDPPKRIAFVTTINGQEQTTTMTFTEDNGRTTVTNAMRFPSREIRDQALPMAKVGTDMNYAHLDEYLAKRRVTTNE